jgi:hypothetical protein
MSSEEDAEEFEVETPASEMSQEKPGTSTQELN